VTVCVLKDGLRSVGAGPIKSYSPELMVSEVPGMPGCHPRGLPSKNQTWQWEIHEKRGIKKSKNI